MKDYFEEFDQAAAEIRTAWQIFTEPARELIGKIKGKLCLALDKWKEAKR